MYNENNMATNENVVRFKAKYPCKLVKWKIHSASRLSVGTVLFLCEQSEHPKSDGKSSDRPRQYLKFKSDVEGTVKSLIAKEGSVVNPGCELFELQACMHQVVMKDMCAECGADLRRLDSNNLAKVAAKASISMIHSIPELRVSHEQAQLLGQADEERLLRNRKLVLLVDLDQTLINTTNENVPPNMKDVFHFQLYGPQSPWYHTKFRPGTHEFLKNVSKLYELHICTFGARAYAHHIASLMDHDGKYFSHRILSRDECFNTTSKTGNLQALFPCGDSLVCIIDDREDVWNFSPNLVTVKPYNFFSQAGDINAPPGLETHPSGDLNFLPERVDQIEEENGDASGDTERGNGTIDGHNGRALNIDDGDAPKADERGNFEPKEEVTEEDVREPGEITEEEETKIFDENAQDNKERSDEDVKETDTLEDETKGDADLEECTEGMSSIVVEKDTIEKEGDSENTNDPVKDDNVVEKETIEKENDKCSEKKVNGKEGKPIVVNNGDTIVVDDSDDYLFYLEEILSVIHKAFYDMYDQMKAQNSEEIPDLKTVIPYVQRKVLKGTNIIFSGLIPTNANVEKSRLWTVARSLGANVIKDLRSTTTHVVASKLGTAKVNQAKRMRGVHVVNPEWLACCAERWEHVDERLFPLRDGVVYKKQVNRNIVMELQMQRFEQLGSCQQQQSKEVSESAPCPVYDPVTGKRIHQQKVVKHCSVEIEPKEKEIKFSDSISPLFYVSSDEIKEMGREVDDECSDDSDNGNESSREGRKKSNSESSSGESLSGRQCPKGWKKRKRSHQNQQDDDDAKKEFGGVIFCEDDEPQTKSSRREFPSDSEKSTVNSEDDGESIGSVDEEMAAAVEREFLSC